MWDQNLMIHDYDWETICLMQISHYSKNALTASASRVMLTVLIMCWQQFTILLISLLSYLEHLTDKFDLVWNGYSVWWLTSEKHPNHVPMLKILK